jgi:hypothetical protein
MRLLIFCLFLLSCGHALAQNDTDQTLQQAQAALKQAQAAVDAAVKAKQASDKAKGVNAQPTAVASDGSTTTTHKQYLPIDVGLDIYTDGTVGASYSYNGKSLQSFQDFADVIHSLNDTRCNSLLDASSTEDTLGWVSMAAGTGLITYYVVDVLNKAFASNYNANSFGPDLSGDTPFLIGGNLVIAAGTVLFVASHGDFTHAINRYNHQVQKNNQLSFYFDPNPAKPELGLVQRF